MLLVAVVEMGAVLAVVVVGVADGGCCFVFVMVVASGTCGCGAGGFGN